MADKTIFQKIIDREIPASIEYEDEACLAFRDIAAQAPTHLLVIPKTPIIRIGEAEDSDAAVLGHLLLVARKMGNKFGPKGFRLVINNGPDGGEAVPHLHIHVLAGRKLEWPPG
ncbi:histidine triad nucleotide-binding protein [Cerasicoccus arenae]|uniref:Histidine triad nucleotide-binding protein n=1 Tax=Cerasicoccus arenae TaxID=424488 RepID=A0A8J3DEM7_9BACT|nr:histidine triad nucleotide-binding protein [Cerasicoccus arenae]MBK1856939.1 histidine triad nucleotide-binding protein [Cerasicoccus arenae]GHB89944.1 histidine triad nucleotide-binding protein [Cerasicoccus arenae]